MAQAWILPTIQNNFVEIEYIEVVADPVIAAFLEYDKSKNEMFYTGEDLLEMTENF